MVKQYKTTETKRKAQARWQKTDAGREYISKWQKTDAGKSYCAKINAKWSKTEAGKLSHSRRDAKWRKENPGKCNAKGARYRASKLQRTPPWLTKSHFIEMEEIYTMARDLQWLSDPTDPLTVDHIIPLQGESVSGLHVPWNLQILPKSMNCSKSNKLTK